MPQNGNSGPAGTCSLLFNLSYSIIDASVPHLKNVQKVVTSVEAKIRPITFTVEASVSYEKSLWHHEAEWMYSTAHPHYWMFRQEEEITISCHMSDQPSAVFAPDPVRQYYEIVRTSMRLPTDE